MSSEKDLPSEKGSQNDSKNPFAKIFAELLNMMSVDEKKACIENYNALLSALIPNPVSEPIPDPVPESIPYSIPVPVVPSWRQCVFCSNEADVICTKCNRQFCNGCKNHRDVRVCSYRDCNNLCDEGYDRCRYHGYRGVSYDGRGNINYDGR